MDLIYIYIYIYTHILDNVPMLVEMQNTPSKADPRPKESAQNFSKEPFHTALLSKAHPFFSKKKKKKNSKAYP